MDLTTVVIISFNRNTHVLNTLKYINSVCKKLKQIIKIIIVSNDIELKDDFSNLSIIIRKYSETEIGGNLSKLRNLGGFSVKTKRILFLDADVIPSYELIKNINNPIPNKHIIMFEPLYLKSKISLIDLITKGDIYLDNNSLKNPYRTSHDNMSTDDFGQFWSLCFSLNTENFKNLKGFDETYIGYGAEDTDFAIKFLHCGYSLFLSDVKCYHQQHSIYRPPINHLESIVSNSLKFYTKHGFFPMLNWLKSFENMGLINFSEHTITIERKPTEKELIECFFPNAPFV